MKKWKTAVICLLFVVCLLLILRMTGESVATAPNAVTVVENNTPIELYELRTFATVYGDYGWTSAQGTRASIELYYIDIFDGNFEKLARYFHNMEEFEDFFAEADVGVYYVAAAVNWNGKYISKEKEYERYGAEFLFGLVKE